jgi:hypothetical protein
MTISAESQEIGDSFRLDTVILIPDHPVRGINPNANSGITANSNYYIIHSFTRVKTDSFCFTFIDKSSKRVQNISPRSSELKKIMFSPEIHAIAANDRYVALVYFMKLALFSITEKNGAISLEFYKAFDIPEAYNYLYFNTDNYILGGRIYNREKNAHEKNSLIHTFRLKDGNLIQGASFNPPFEDVEFSHFSPSHWIATNGTDIAVSQTTTYQIDMYDTAGTHKYAITEQRPEWVQMEKKRLKQLRTVVPEHQPGILIDSLKNDNDKRISRIEGVWFVNKNLLAVRYYIVDTTIKKRLRYFDLYELQDSKATLVKKGLVDFKFPVDIHKIVTTHNFDMLSWNYTNFVGTNEILILRNFTPVTYLGKEWTEGKKEEEKYYDEHDPIISLLIFKLKQ